MRFATVSVTKDSLTHIFNTFLFGILSVKIIIKTLHIINVTVHSLLEIKLFANEIITDKKKIFPDLPYFVPSWILS